MGNEGATDPRSESPLPHSERWYRVFAGVEDSPAPGAILAFVNGLVPATGNFGGDEAGWFRAEILCDGLPPLEIERYQAGDKALRAELNSWAAWVETHESYPNRVALMERLIQAKQLFTLRGGDERLCLALCRFFAGTTKGMYQADGSGLFDGNEALLLAE